MRYWVGAESLPLSRHVIAELSRAGMMAPSIHQRHPWRIQVDPERQTIELHANPDPRLESSDPTGRIVHVACGAAVFNLRLAAALAGREAIVVLLPEPATPSLLATIRLAGPHSARRDERELYAAITASLAGLGPSPGEQVPDAVLAQLVDAACTEGATLRILANPGTAIPATLAGNVEPAVFAFVTDSPQLAVLSTTMGPSTTWLRAGQALERVLLTATARGIAAMPFVLLRGSVGAPQVIGENDGIEQPQMILRFGDENASPDRRTELLTVCVAGTSKEGGDHDAEPSSGRDDVQRGRRTSERRVQGHSRGHAAQAGKRISGH